MEWLKAIAPTAATLLGGPLAGMAVEAIGSALGVSDATKEKVTEVLQSRKMAASTGDIWTPRVIAIVVFLVWGVVQYHVFTSTIPEGMRELVARMLGTLDAVLMAVVYYYYGSSSGSAAKTQAMVNK